MARLPTFLRSVYTWQRIDSHVWEHQGIKTEVSDLGSFYLTFLRKKLQKNWKHNFGFANFFYENCMKFFFIEKKINLIFRDSKFFHMCEWAFRCWIHIQRNSRDRKASKRIYHQCPDLWCSVSQNLKPKNTQKMLWKMEQRPNSGANLVESNFSEAGRPPKNMLWLVASSLDTVTN